MFRRFSANFAVISIFFDLSLVAIALHISSLLRTSVFNQLPLVQFIPDTIDIPYPLYILFPLTWVITLLIFSIYDGRKNLRVTAELGSLTLASIFSTISMAGILYLSFRDVSRFLFLFFVFLSFVFLIAWRLIFRLVFRWGLLNSVQRRRLLILGAGKIGHRLAQNIQQMPYQGLGIIGYLDDDPEKQENDPLVLGTLDYARAIIEKYKVDDVVIALPLSAHQRLTQVVSDIHDLPVRVWVIPDYFSMTLHHASFEELAGIPMLDLRAPALSEYQRMIKRAFDLVMSMISLPFLIPVMGLISLAIKLDSKGPVFFTQDRVGENGKLFKMIKFRTMIQDAEKQRHLVEQHDKDGRLIHKTPRDPRVTQLGKFLRRTSLDELPQVINVLKGEMSLVGPRPEMPYLVEQYEPWQRKRFAVPQGITGWWQINGRSDKPMHLHTEEDLYYVQHYSIWFDLQIIIKTLWVALRGKGAY